MKELNKLETNIINILSQLDKAYSTDIGAELPFPGVAYTTLSFTLRILENKGIIGHEKEGRKFRYFIKMQA